MTEVGVEKSVVGGGSVEVQGFQNARGGENRVSQGAVLVDQFGNPLTDLATSHVTATANNVSTTAAKVFDAPGTDRVRTRLGLGISAGAFVYAFFGAGTGKTYLECYGPMTVGGLYEWAWPACPQGEVWLVTESGDATVHPMQILTVKGTD